MVRALTIALLLSCSTALAGGADISKINDSIRIDARQSAGDLSTVNGSIRVGEGARVGEIETVNGSIQIGKGARVDSVETVNGGIDLGDDVQVDSVESLNGTLRLATNVRVQRDVSAVNGSVLLDRGTRVSGDVSTVNGRVVMDDAHVEGRLETVSGDMEIRRGSRVGRGILVERNRGHSFFNFWTRDPKIVIGPDVVIDGTLRFERDVELYVSDQARIGRVVGADPIRFSGEDSGMRRRSKNLDVEK